MHPVVLDRLAERARARSLGDLSLERACNADLARYGYRDDAPETVVPDPGEMERAVPPQPRRGGRPKLPRCEHDQIVGRCLACEQGDEDDD